MPGLQQGKSFSNRFIYYHLISIIVTLSVTLLAAFFLLQSNQSRLQQEHVDNVLKLNQGRLIASLMDETGSRTGFLEQLLSVEDLQHICLELSNTQNARRLYSWPVSKESDCRSLLDGTESNQLSASIAVVHNDWTGMLVLSAGRVVFFDPMKITLVWILLLLATILTMGYMVHGYIDRHYIEPLVKIRQALEKLSTGKDNKNSQQQSLKSFSQQVIQLIETTQQQEIDLLESKQKFEGLYSALQESEEYFKALFQQANEAILLLQKPSLRFSHFNRTAHQLLGYERGQFAHLTIHDIVASAENEDGPFELTGETIPTSFSVRMIRADGTSLDCHVSSGDLQIQDMNFRMLMFHDVSEQLRVQRELVALNSQLQTVLDASKHLAIIAVDDGGVIQIFNKGAENILKYDRNDVIGHLNLTDVIKECQIETETSSGRDVVFNRMVSAMRSDSLMTSSCTYVDSNQNEIPVEQTLTQIVDDNGNSHGYLCIAMDLRDRLAEKQRQSELESQLQHSQKMETIGTLAGGIAHDLNNLLTPVMGYTEMLLEDTRDNDKYQRRLQRVLNASLRAKELVKQILTFSHHVDHVTEPAEVKSIVKEVLELMFATLPPNIQLTVDIKDPDTMINCDVTKIHQVLMNLCTNAAHAIGEKNGTITIEIDSVQHEAKDSDLMLPTGRYVLLVVSDTGCGMSEVSMKRIFEPFYTTKDIGEGTGLGLSVVHGIIRSHNGTIRVSSKPNKGSSFSVFLPYHQVNSENQTEITSTLYGSGKRIMIVDDDLPVLQLSQELLKRRGYVVEAFNSSKDALQAFKLVPDSFDVIITDQSMPEMTGTQLSRQIRKISKTIPILLLTGLGNILSPEERSKLGINRVISKPVLSNDLIQIIYEISEQNIVSDQVSSETND